MSIDASKSRNVESPHQWTILMAQWLQPSGSGHKRPHISSLYLSLPLALFLSLWFCNNIAEAAPPVDPLVATCAEGEFLHIHAGSCLPLHTTYGFDSFTEPTAEIRLLSCDVAELRQAVSQGNRKIFLRSGCTYNLGDQDLALKSNTVIDGMSNLGSTAETNASAAISGTLFAQDVLSQTVSARSAYTSTLTSPTESLPTETIITCTGTTAFRVHDVSNVVIRNLTVDGQNDQQDDQGCGTLIFIDQGADNVLVERLRLRNGLGKGVGFRTASRVTVRYSWVEDMWDDHGLNADNQFVDIAYYSNYITRVGLSSGETGYGINSHASKAEIAGNYIENTDSGIKLMGARYTLLHHNTVVGASSQNPLYRGVWTAIDDNDNVRPISLVYYDNFIDTDGVRPFSILDGATDIYLAGNHYGSASNYVPISRDSGVYHCADSSDAQLTGALIKITSRLIEFPDSGMEPFDPCLLQADPTPAWTYAISPTIRTEPQNQELTVGEEAVFSVSIITATTPALSATSSITNSSTISDSLSYQWQRRFGNGRWYDIRSATESSYQTGALRLYNNGNQYRVKIQNQYGSTVSQVAVLTVKPEAEAVAPCIQASSIWQSRPISSPANRFRATFIATPKSRQNDGLIGFSFGPADEFSDLAVIVRFGRSGSVDVRNGAEYAADFPIEYTQDETLHFRIEVDVSKHIYSVYVASVTDGKVNNDELELADDYAFRSEQADIKTVDTWGIWDGQGDLEVCNLQP